MVVSIKFTVTFLFIFENVIEILTGPKFNLSLLLEVPLSSEETTFFQISFKNLICNLS